MFSLDNISMRFGSLEIFRNVSMIVNPRDRIGLVGRNGAGKTTMLRIFAGIQEPSEGQVVNPPGTEVGYLPQEGIHVKGHSLMEECLSAFAEARTIQKKIDSLSTELEGLDPRLWLHVHP